jgi:AcrR family transcriptional regulator
MSRSTMQPEAPRPRPAGGGGSSSGGGSTAARILDAALASFGTRGYEATSLDALAAGLSLRKQTILYWFPSKEALLAAVIDHGALELSAALEAALDGAGPGWSKIETVVRTAFRLGARRPELIGLLRETGRLGPDATTRFMAALDPMVRRAAEFLDAEMSAGTMRRHEPRLLLFAIYSTVVGMITEVELLRALGEEPNARSLVRRRSEILGFLRSALMTESGETLAVEPGATPAVEPGATPAVEEPASGEIRGRPHPPRTSRRGVGPTANRSGLGVSADLG